MSGPKPSFVALVVAVWLAALTPAGAVPIPAGSEPIQIGLGIEDQELEFGFGGDEDDGDGEDGGGRELLELDDLIEFDDLLEDLGDSVVGEIAEDVADEVLQAVDVLVCIVGRRLDRTPSPTPCV